MKIPVLNRQLFGRAWNRFGLGSFLLILAFLAVTVPFIVPASSDSVIGFLLLLAGACELFHSFRLAEDPKAGYLSGTVTLGMGALVLTAPVIVRSAFVVFFALFFLTDSAVRARAILKGQARRRNSLLALGNLLLAGVLVFTSLSYPLTLALAGSLRLFECASTMLTSEVLESRDAGRTVAEDLDLPDFEELTELARTVGAGAEASRGVDRRWIVVILIVLLSIHFSRMPVEWNLLSLSGPLFALLGDIAVALFVSFGLLVPAYLLVRKPLKKPLSYAFRVAFAPETRARPGMGLLRACLTLRLRFAIRLRQSAYSLDTALERGLALGLPVSLILTATVPVWGMNWYFDTEKWASGLWHRYAAHRTVNWRQAMVRAAVQAEDSAYSASGFRLSPELSGDFSYIVVGDPGEGDASQLVLKDQILKCGSQPEVQFLIVSSDVVYPDGAMRDYEARFFLPFKGFEKPIYAIPGNHDWYDGLESFTAVFFQPEAARRALLARSESESGLTFTDEPKVDKLLAQASRLSAQYGLSVGHQKAPYFQISHDSFCLIALDTGVLRRLDAEQERWLDSVLEAQKGKFLFVLLGHPFYAEGLDWVEAETEFARLKARLERAGVNVIMAGDTHDFEYYREPQEDGSFRHHFVNGGGGAFMSYGPALAWPEEPALQDWAIYPGKDDVVQKIESFTPWFKRPLWWWTLYAGAWPFSAKWLSAAFDYNRAPFHQSFVEVQVLASQQKVRLIPWGVDGPLRWEQLQQSGRLTTSTASGTVVFEIPFPERSAPTVNETPPF